jgi:hypothetical protein
LAVASLLEKYTVHGAIAVGSLGLLGHAMALAVKQTEEVTLTIHNLPVFFGLAKIATAHGKLYEELIKGKLEEVSGDHDN